mgnify:CR=1 FL=1
MSYKEIYELSNELYAERLELVEERIEQIVREPAIEPAFADYFTSVAKCINTIKNHSADKEFNDLFYSQFDKENYEKSYANPAYAVKVLGDEYGQLLSAVYAKIAGSITHIYQGDIKYLCIYAELIVELYNYFENANELSPDEIRGCIYSFMHDYEEIFAEDDNRALLDPAYDYYTELVNEADLSNDDYLYSYGLYVGENERAGRAHLASFSDEEIQAMADTYTEGYRIGFVNTGKDLSKKSVVNIRYILGFERVVKKAIENFEKMGLKPVIYRAAVSVLTKRQHIKIGYYGAVANKQYEYDHKDDQALFMDKKYLERKLEVMQTTYEHHKKEAAGFAGPACIDMFGEEPFEPEAKETVAKLSKSQEEMILQYDSRQSQMVNQYIKGEERSFTIIAYPVPEIGEKYEEIFDEIIRINTLDAKLYEKVQQTLIDALDQGEYVHILGTNGNRTDLNVQLHPLNDPKKETIFENCVADVNIPVGEVFTSPVLEGTNGVLHVSKVYLNELQYRDLEITFSNGMVSEYNCANFERELENKAYIHDNVLYKHPTLPLGEFAIGTNTTAYVTAKKYGIEDKMPILIAEKMGPHFAVGDTCYSWCEDIKVYNPNGKEIIARDNSVSIRRKEDVSKAYFHCHTDITIPYEELGSITVITKDKKEITLLENGKFVLPGTEILNEPLKNSNK